MNNTKGLFEQLLENSMKGIEMISSIEKKVELTIELAKAVAINNLLKEEKISSNNIDLNTVPKDTLEDKKDELVNNTIEGVNEVVKNFNEKQEVKKAPKEEVKEVEEIKEEVKQEVKEEPKEEVKQDPKEEVIDINANNNNIQAPDYSEENKWNKDNIQDFQQEIAELKKYAMSLGEEATNKYVEEFSQGVLKNGLQDIGPLNIKPFLVFLKRINIVAK